MNNRDSVYQDLFDDVIPGGAFTIVNGNARQSSANDAKISTYIQSFNIDAKRSSAIYGASDTVQPNATTALILIKT